jgi:hypothetical protein
MICNSGQTAWYLAVCPESAEICLTAARLAGREFRIPRYLEAYVPVSVFAPVTCVYSRGCTG